MTGQDLGQYRCPTPLQGKALEVIGHAIEYLVDSREGSDWPSGALQILMNSSKEIFMECEVIQSPQSPFTRLVRFLSPKEKSKNDPAPATE